MINQRKVIITEIVRQEFSAPVDYHINPKQSKAYVYPRKALCMLIREYASFSLMEIARYLGKHEHSTIMHAIVDGKNLLTQDEAFRASYQKSKERVKSLIND